MTVPDRQAAQRRRSVALAGHSGGSARAEGVRTARRALQDPEPAVRATALGALDRLGRLGFEELRAAAVDPDPPVRVRAAELAHRFGGHAADLLIDRLGDRRPDVVEAACFSLGEIGEECPGAAVDALAVVVAGHDDALCREAAVAALGSIGPTTGSGTGQAAVLGAMADKPQVRRRAVLALAAFDGPDVEAALRGALADRDWQVRQAAEDLTGERPTD